MTNADNRPLAGLKVADFSWFGAGPICAQNLARFGATVVRVESEAHLDGLRGVMPFATGKTGHNVSGYFNNYNAGKLGVTINMSNELGREMGAFIRTIGEQAGGGAAGRRAALRTLGEHHDLDDMAARNLLAYLDEEREVTGSLPTDRTIVVQRFRDELGDWRVVLLSPFGARVHAPWCLAIEARLRVAVRADDHERS